MNNVIPVITLDGPSGTGKGTLCHMLAKQLGWHFFDSGALYRVLAHAACVQEIPVNDVEALVDLAYGLNVRFALNHEQTSIVLLDGHDISEAIRSEQCGQNASRIAIIPEVRQALLARQRAFAMLPGLVTDGRDMGTVVFPDAVLKIYLYASEQARAMRRYLQLKEKDNHVNLAQVVDELTTRDARDMARLHAPLKPADDAVHIDTTDLTIEEVFQRVLTLVGHL